jgi:hypothetical protein
MIAVGASQEAISNACIAAKANSQISPLKAFSDLFFDFAFKPRSWMC